MRYSIAFASFSFAVLALAKTDLEGCTTTDVSSPAGASVAWYVPGTGELCDPLDCGGGRAPPKTTVPGCPQYSGTETYSPSYLQGYNGAQETGAASTSSAAPDATVTTSAGLADAPASETSSSSFDWSAAETDTAISSWDLYTETTAGATSGATSSAAVIATSESSSTPASSAAPQTTIAGAGSNGTAYSTGRPGSGSSNGTIGNGTSSPSTTASIAGAAQTAWVSGAGLMIGLGALVAAL